MFWIGICGEPVFREPLPQTQRGTNSKDPRDNSHQLGIEPQKTGVTGKRSIFMHWFFFFVTEQLRTDNLQRPDICVTVFQQLAKCKSMAQAGSASVTAVLCWWGYVLAVVSSHSRRVKRHGRCHSFLCKACVPSTRLRDLILPMGLSP